MGPDTPPAAGSDGADSPAVIPITQEEHSQHSPCQDESPPPTVQNPEM